VAGKYSVAGASACSTDCVAGKYATGTAGKALALVGCRPKNPSPHGLQYAIKKLFTQN
jgi:hypothetical protein